MIGFIDIEKLQKKIRLYFGQLFRLLAVCACVQSCATLCNPRLSGSSVHGTFQARILEWVAISFSRVLS